jgi:hypothetical protein
MEPEAEVALGSLQDRKAALEAMEATVAETSELDFGFQPGGGLTDRLAAFDVQAGDAAELDEDALDWMAAAFGGDGRDNSALAAAFGMSEATFAPTKGATKKKEVSSRVAEMLLMSEAATAQAATIDKKDDLESPFKKELQGSIAAQLASLQQKENDANAKAEVERHTSTAVTGSIAKMAQMHTQSQEESGATHKRQESPSKKAISGGIADRLGNLLAL